MIDYIETVQYHLREQGYTEDQARIIALQIDEKFMLICQNQIEERQVPPLAALYIAYDVTVDHYGHGVALALTIVHAQRLRDLEKISKATAYFTKMQPDFDSPHIEAAREYVSETPDTQQPPSEGPQLS